MGVFLGLNNFGQGQKYWSNYLKPRTNLISSNHTHTSDWRCSCQIGFCSCGFNKKVRADPASVKRGRPLRCVVWLISSEESPPNARRYFSYQMAPWFSKLSFQLVSTPSSDGLWDQCLISLSWYWRFCQFLITTSILKVYHVSSSLPLCSLVPLFFCSYTSLFMLFLDGSVGVKMINDDE